MESARNVGLVSRLEENVNIRQPWREDMETVAAIGTVYWDVLSLRRF
jgi:hypothetical protein